MKKLSKVLFSLIATVVAPRSGADAEGVARSAERDAADEKALAAVFALAKKHDLGHLVAHALAGEKLDPELLGKAEKVKLTAVWRVKNIENEQGRVRKCLEGAGIPFVLLKGAVVRDYYPEPWMRTSSDIDVLVPSDGLGAVVDAFREGYVSA